MQAAKVELLCCCQALEIHTAQLEEQIEAAQLRITTLEYELDSAVAESEQAQLAAEVAQEDYEKLRAKLDEFAASKWTLETKLKEVRPPAAL